MLPLLPHAFAELSEDFHTRQNWEGFDNPFVVTENLDLKNELGINNLSDCPSSCSKAVPPKNLASCLMMTLFEFARANTKSAPALWRVRWQVEPGFPSPTINSTGASNVRAFSSAGEDYSSPASSESSALTGASGAVSSITMAFGLLIVTTDKSWSGP